MAGGGADERQIRVDPAVLEHQPESPHRPLPRPHGAREVSSPPIPEELLLDIFSRIPDPTDLVLTSAACVAFRSLITDRSFLRQYRKLHAPPLLGFLGSYRGFHFQPADPPYHSASVARAVALAADFSFSFVPAPAPDHRWFVRDICNGRVLLSTIPKVLFTKMAVCDPLHRHYLLLPPIPDDLAATVEDRQYLRRSGCEIFLVPHHGDEAATAEETSFRVIWMVQCLAKLVAFVFSSSTGQWRAIPSQSWSDLFAGLPSFVGNPLFSQRQYACGFFHWLPNWQYELKLLVLDTRRMAFSIADPPSEVKYASTLDITMVEAGEGRSGMLVHGHDTSGRIYTVWRNNGGNPTQWQKEMIISPSLGSGCMLSRSMGKYLILHNRSLLEPGLCMLDIRTLQVERVCASAAYGRAYSNYPPSLSSPKVSSGIEEEVLEQGVEALQGEGSVDGHQDESTADDADAGRQADVLTDGDGAN